MGLLQSFKEAKINRVESLEAQGTRGIIKMLISGIQMNSIVLQFDYQWPEGMTQSYGFASNSFSPVDGIITFDCIYKNYAFLVSPFYSKAVYMLLFPMLCIAVFYLALLVRSMYIARRQTLNSGQPTAELLKLGLRESQPQLIASIFFIGFLVYPLVTRVAFQFVRCYSIDNQKALVYDTTQACWTGDHLVLFITFGIPLFVLYVFGVPFAGLYFLLNHRHELRSEEVQAKFGFIYRDYSEKYFFWEIIVTFRKATLIVIAVFSASGQASVTLFWALLVCVCFLTLQLAFSPFSSKVVNRLEVLSLTNSFLLLYFGQELVSKNCDGNAMCYVSWVVILASNLLWICSTIVVLFRTCFCKKKGVPQERRALRVTSVTMNSGESAMNRTVTDSFDDLHPPGLLSIPSSQQTTSRIQLTAVQ
jgi:hypothetical protein